MFPPTESISISLLRNKLYYDGDLEFLNVIEERVKGFCNNDKVRSEQCLIIKENNSTVMY